MFVAAKKRFLVINTNAGTGQHKQNCDRSDSNGTERSWFMQPASIASEMF